jgi:trehalose/maltose hydrolase-like predicted phosphorylase
VNHWSLRYDGFDPGDEGLRESLCTLGNGYVATRGAAPESSADDVHYPGTYVAGCYNRLTSVVAGRTVQNEDLVNVPNWLPVRFRVDGGEWLDLSRPGVLDHRQELDTRRGVLTRQTRFRDPSGRVIEVAQRRLVSMDDPHLAGLETTFLPTNWSGKLEVEVDLDGRVTNSGVARYRDLDGHHLRPIVEGWDEGAGTMWLQVETTSSQIRIAEAARVLVTGSDGRVSQAFERADGWVGLRMSLAMHEGSPVTVEKVVAIYTSRDRAISECLDSARLHVDRARSFDELLTDHVRAWGRLWRAGRIVVPGEPQRIVNLHVFHLLQTLSEHTIDLDVGVPARGLHGEAYRGHVFWDELFVFPYLTLRFPATARALLMYRWRRLPVARQAAADAGFRGAMYPWQSGSSGRDETPRLHLNPASGRWLEDHTDLQRHVGIAVAHNVWQYCQATGDLTFLAGPGVEMLVEIARFWCSMATYNRADDRYEILGVVGPDEYHDRYPGSDRPGIDNNAYTNVMAARVVRHALDALALLPEHQRTAARERLRLDYDETDLFEHVSRKMHVAFHGDGILSQFEGYDRLAELDWAAYRARYGNIRRLDRILEAEGDTVETYQASKQADVLMLYFLLGERELRATLALLGYEFDAAAADRTIDYYLSRTSHGSTLSAVVHAWVLASKDRSASWQFFLEALASDVADVQGGTTREGIHLGAMAGTIDLLQRCYTGLELRDDVLRLEPRLPSELTTMEFQLRYRGHWGVELRCTHDRVRVGLLRSAAAPIKVALDGQARTLAPGEAWEIDLPDPTAAARPSDREVAMSR